MTDSFLPYGRQQLDDDDLAVVAAVLRGEYLTGGPAVASFEEGLAARVGSRFAVACSSGTAALHLACLAANVTSEDRIVTSPITFLASANCARFVGAEVAFADIDPTSGLIDPAAVEKVVSDYDDLKAIIPVHFAGAVADMPRIAATATAHGLVVIEDACHALGATYEVNGETVAVGSCRHADMAVFSFHPVKHVAAGEGGAVTTNDETLYRRLLRLRNHGMTRDAADFVLRDMAFTDGTANPWYYEMDEIGYNYRLTDFQAALAESQLKKLDRFLERRRDIAAEYLEALGRRLSGVVEPLVAAPVGAHAWHLFVALIDFEKAGTSRAAVMKGLQAVNIGSQVHYIPVPLQPYYRRRYGHREGDFPSAERYYRQALSLPIYPAMPDDGVVRVVEALEHLLESRS
jgi:UDP-4-amino-4,6-dideoxy-N-acetyl-beta-L-altrosamine transaminase